MPPGSLEAKNLRDIWLLIAAVPRENDEPVGGNGYWGRVRHAVHRSAGCVNSAAIARDHRVDPVVVNVAVEHFEPSIRTKTPGSRCAYTLPRSQSGH